MTYGVSGDLTGSRISVNMDLSIVFLRIALFFSDTFTMHGHVVSNLGPRSKVFYCYTGHGASKGQ